VTTAPLRFDEDVVIVTGAGAGLGRAYALELARRGARVVVNDLGGSVDGVGGDRAAASRVVQEITDAGGQAVASFESVATDLGGRAIVARALDAWGRLDGLISNAGILRDKSFAKVDWTDNEAVLDVHLRGGFFVGQPAFNAMRDAGRGGRILFTTSPSGLFGTFGQTSYGAAKMGLIGVMRSLALEAARFDIKVNAIAPIAATRLTSGDEPDDGPRSAAKVAPAAVALTHRSCPVSGEIVLAGYGWFSRPFIGLTPGWDAPAGEITAEAFLDHWDQIADPTDFIEPRSTARIAEMLRARIDAKTPEA
jgi:NAD(P)-dependent dehydrogenase (short-subunit alcohol dehydrogenase family)